MHQDQVLLQKIARERPAGTQANAEVGKIIEVELRAAGCQMSSFSFPCLRWTRQASYIQAGDALFPIHPSPYTDAFDGAAQVRCISSLQDVLPGECAGKILVLTGDLAKEPIQAQASPFYFPDEHRDFLHWLEKSRCAAVIAVTGQAALNGMNPFPLFMDGDLPIPTAYLGEAEWRHMEPEIARAGTVRLVIASKREPAQATQIIGRQEALRARGKIVVAAHMDSQHETPGALDNAAGVVMLIRLAHMLREDALPYTVEYVPFNSEEYFSNPAEVLYLEKQRQGPEAIQLFINIDSPCHRGAEIALAGYHMDGRAEEAFGEMIAKSPGIAAGEPWYAGDHFPYLEKGIPCITAASSDFFTGGLKDTHTPRDMPQTVDAGQLAVGAGFLARWIRRTR